MTARTTLGWALIGLSHIITAGAMIAAIVLEVWMSVQAWPNLIWIFFGIPLTVSLGSAVACLVGYGVMALGVTDKGEA